MTLSARHLAEAAYLTGEELARRRRTGIPVPRHLVELYDVLLAEVSACGQQACQSPTAEPALTLETSRQRANRVGISERTIRRRAAARGQTRIGNRYVFERP